MLTIYPNNAFYWRSPVLRASDGTRYGTSVTATGWLAAASGEGPITLSEKPATKPKPGAFAIAYTVSEVNRIVRNRIGSTLLLVLKIDGTERYEVPVLVTQSREPGR